MAFGLTITVVARDDDYLGLEIHVSNNRYAGATWIFAGNEELTKFAAQIAGFPTNARDERRYEFGTRDRSFAGGYCNVHFGCLDSSGHVIVEVAIEDDKQLNPYERAQLTFRVEAGAIDRFTKALPELERTRSGQAMLPSVD